MMPHPFDLPPHSVVNGNGVPTRLQRKLIFFKEMKLAKDRDANISNKP